ncbi:MAG: hypothetical protein ACRC8S_07365 [Fimbriiglobus sp.]
MSYRFTGFFARSLVEQPTTLPVGAVWRTITSPFIGIGVSLPDRADLEPTTEEVRRLLAEVGLGGETDWLFIEYDTWGGPIDSVYGLGSSGGQAFGPVSESAHDKVQAAYLSLMAAFGLAEADALDFPPFVRGFWGE